MNHDSRSTEPPRDSSPTTGRVLIVGAVRDGQGLARLLGEGPWAGMPLVGFVDAGTPRSPRRRAKRRQLAVHPQADPVPVLGGIDRLGEVIGRVRATHVLISLSERWALRLLPRLQHLATPEVSLHWLGEPVRAAEPRAQFDWDRSIRPVRSASIGQTAKRIVDLVGAAAGLVILSPLFAVVSLLILIASGRPILYSQVRVGQGGRTFRILKFRSMRVNAEGSTGPVWATQDDSRCTHLGLWLRRTNIDELPQLFNVLRGEMSLVGPRPERPVFVERFREGLPDYDLRHAVPVGMTGWAQVHGWRGRTSLRKRLQYDLDYIRRWSFWLDFAVLLMTLQHVFLSKTSWGSPKRSLRS